MRDIFGPSSTPCSPFLKHARHTSKEPEGTHEARLSCVWWTKRKRALFPLVTEERSEDSPRNYQVQCPDHARFRHTRGNIWLGPMETLPIKICDISTMSSKQVEDR